MIINNYHIINNIQLGSGQSTPQPGYFPASTNPSINILSQPIPANALKPKVPSAQQN